MHQVNRSVKELQLLEEPLEEQSPEYIERFSDQTNKLIISNLKSETKRKKRDTEIRFNLDAQLTTLNFNRNSLSDSCRFQVYDKSKTSQGFFQRKPKSLILSNTQVEKKKKNLYLKQIQRVILNPYKQMFTRGSTKTLTKCFSKGKGIIKPYYRAKKRQMEKAKSDQERF